MGELIISVCIGFKSRSERSIFYNYNLLNTFPTFTLPQNVSTGVQMAFGDIILINIDISRALDFVDHS